MTAIIFVPGILGSELFLNEEKIWPPSLPEIMVTGYQRLELLMDPNVKAGNPISNVLIVDFYSWTSGGIRAESYGFDFEVFYPLVT